MTFLELPVGTKFRWASNIGAGDPMRKIGENMLLNLKTRNRYEPNVDRHGFGPDDPVIVLPLTSEERFFQRACEEDEQNFSES